MKKKLTLRDPSAGGDDLLWDDDSFGIGNLSPLPVRTNLADSTADGDEGLSDSVSAAAAKPVATITTLANYLISGYWSSTGKSAHHWAGHTVTVNINGLSTDEKIIATSALNAWHEVANISFTFVNSGANITYVHTGTRTAVTNATWSGSTMTSATVDISSDWAGGASTGINSYFYQTYIHETGHALGLGHQGPYNGDGGSYDANAMFANDTWQFSVMSYWAQSNYDGGYHDYVLTPQMADISAIQTIYGVTTTRAADTVYGFHNTAGPIYDFTSYTFAPAFTIYDSGGNDTIDASGYSMDQTIDLTPGNWSSIGGNVHDIGIYLTANIENAVGGSGDDTIIGNTLANTLSGGDGTDTIRGAGGNDTLDGGLGIDTAQFSGLRSAYTLTRTGNSLRVVGPGPDGTDTLTRIEKLAFSDGTVPGLTVVPTDFNGEGRADFLWQNNNGTPGVTLMNGVNPVSGAYLPNAGPAWHVSHGADFNGDGKADILWQHDNGTPGITLMNGLAPVSGAYLGNAGPAWHIKAGADFDGDGKADLLWQNDDGTPGVTLMDGVNPLRGAFLPNAGPAWHITDAADFNGDGKADILWQNIDGTPAVTLMDGLTPVSGAYLGNAGPSWHIKAGADFNGDGKADILWQHDNGTPGITLMDGLTPVSGAYLPNAGPAWHVIGGRDFDGDGKADILWQHDNGTPAVTLMNGLTPISGAFLGNPGSDWHLI